MNWQALVEVVAERADLPKNKARAALGALAAVLQDALADGEEVYLSGVGTFGSRWEPERTLRSVRDGRKLAIDGRWHPAFRAAAPLRARVRARTPQILKDVEHQRAWRLAEALVGDLDLYHQRAIPAGITTDTEPAEVEALCAHALGPAWARARQTWTEQTPPDVRSTRDHLVMSARRRWAVDVT